eukprot:gnl/TRDRNA2_/TRDRNA2_177468_c6_seq19.p1 gnl/TRDRNA2_/TRDRNA2_177468_c6~~gnl/TRDRNA2_/TRDRNA2_177468_c6_seq19.p1  ORF type:complete len:174 (-),score=35.22 gnl/TRDRNA2_/TRDRNA2_177468_c6_seq19:179-700(-)
MASVLLISDGTPSFKFQTKKAVSELKARAKVTIVHVKSLPSKESVELMKSYASQPWQSNYVQIPGKAALKSAYGSWVDQVIVEACPLAESPSMLDAAAQMDGFRKTFEFANCGDGIAQAFVESPGACNTYAASMTDSYKSFAYGKGHCLVYDDSCEQYRKNSTYNVYVPEARS